MRMVEMRHDPRPAAFRRFTHSIGNDCRYEAVPNRLEARGTNQMVNGEAFLGCRKG
jgi:hypothetical protein